MTRLHVSLIAAITIASFACLAAVLHRAAPAAQASPPQSAEIVPPQPVQQSGNLQATLLSVNTGLFYAEADQWGGLKPNRAALEAVKPDQLKPFQYVEVFIHVQGRNKANGANSGLTIMGADGERWKPETDRLSEHAAIGTDADHLISMGPICMATPRQRNEDAVVFRKTICSDPQTNPLPNPLTIELTLLGESFTFEKIPLP